MSEELRSKLFEAFAQTAQTLEQAEAKAKEEKGFERIERFSTPEEGEYMVRVLPLAPIFDENGNTVMPMNKQGCEFKLYNTFLEIEGAVNKKTGKAKVQRIPVIRATQPGVDKSVDLLDEYLRIAKDMYADDEDVISLLTDSQSRHRIKYNNQRVLYVYDLDGDKPKGPLMWTISNSSWKSIDEERRSVWIKEKAKHGENTPDPMCSFQEAWPLIITRTGKGFGDTKYAFKIDRGEDKVALTQDMLGELYDLPRIPDEIYRYTRYQMEATIEFLKQYDEKHDLEVTKDEEFLAAIETLKGELPSDDTSHFTLGGSSDSKVSDKKESKITLDSLNEAYDYIVDNNLGKDSDEVDELREDIRQFIEDNELDVVVKHSKKLKDLLEEVEDAMEDKSKTPVAPAKAETKKEEPEEEQKAEDEDDKDKEEESVRPARRRPRRPSADEEEVPAKSDDEDNEKPADEEQEEETHRRPRRTR